MHKTMVIMIGLQGSGKSTFYEKYLSEEYIRVNLDTLRTRHQERLLMDECFAQEKCFAIDNTNPTREDRSRYISLAKANGYHIIGYFMQSKIKDCIARNTLREGKARVPEKGILPHIQDLLGLKGLINLLLPTTQTGMAEQAEQQNMSQMRLLLPIESTGPIISLI